MQIHQVQMLVIFRWIVLELFLAFFFILLECKAWSEVLSPDLDKFYEFDCKVGVTDCSNLLVCKVRCSRKPWVPYHRLSLSFYKGNNFLSTLVLIRINLLPKYFCFCFSAFISFFGLFNRTNICYWLLHTVQVYDHFHITCFSTVLLFIGLSWD